MASGRARLGRRHLVVRILQKGEGVVKSGRTWVMLGLFFAILLLWDCCRSGSANPLPPLLKRLGNGTDGRAGSRQLTQRLQSSFPVGSPESKLIRGTQRDGFELFTASSATNESILHQNGRFHTQYLQDGCSRKLVYGRLRTDDRHFWFVFRNVPLTKRSAGGGAKDCCGSPAVARTGPGKLLLAGGAVVCTDNAPSVRHVQQPARRPPNVV